MGIKGITDYSVCTNHADRLSGGDMYEQPYGANRSGILFLILIKLIKQKEVFQNEIKIQETNSSDSVGYADN